MNAASANLSQDPDRMVTALPAPPSTAPTGGHRHPQTATPGPTIPHEAIVAAAHAIAKEHGSDVFDPNHQPYEYTNAERAQYWPEAEAAAEVLAPYFAAALTAHRRQTEPGT